MPKHVAVIIDGNRRWARSQGLVPQAGAEALKMVVDLCRKWGIQVDNNGGGEVGESEDVGGESIWQNAIYKAEVLSHSLYEQLLSDPWPQMELINAIYPISSYKSTVSSSMTAPNLQQCLAAFDNKPVIDSHHISNTTNGGRVAVDASGNIFIAAARPPPRMPKEWNAGVYNRS